MNSSATSALLRQYSSLKLNDSNEAATRLKVIDHVLRQILGWTDDDIDPEEHVTEDGTTTYSDYILRTANTAIVVEAKKAGAAFAASSGSRRVKLSNTFLQSELGLAIVQARDYARKFGIDFAVATNGAVWAVFPAQRHDQVKFNESSALVFWSLDDALNENFQEFYDLLSREAVICGSLETTLLGRVGDQIEHRKLNSFFSTSARVNLSNPAFHIIDNELTLAFSDSIVELDDASFERCYVASPESLRFDHKIRMHVNRRDPLISGSITRALKPTDANALVSKIQASALGKKPLAILLLGTVGAGKTTFLHYMQKVRLKDVLTPDPSKPYPHWVHLDFLTNSPSSSAAAFIYASLKDYIGSDPFLRDYDRCVKHAYADEIRTLKSGPLFSLRESEEKINERISDLILKEYQETKPYVDRVIRYATKHAAFFLVIDNVDQIEDEEAQSALFTEALAIARSLSINLVLCLRQSTFAKHRNSPGIDAFDFEPVQVDPPRITSVISKRFNLVRYLCEGKKGEFVAENGAKVKVENAAQIVDLLQGSVLGTEIGTRIEVLATEDVRLALRMTREFLERGYTNPGRAIEFHKRTGRYVLPRHEAFRAIILGTRRVYDEDFSSIGNPFDSRLSVTQAQLLRLFVLSAVVAYASENGFRFLDGSSIAECLRKVGFGDNFTSKIIGDLCTHRFLFTANHGDASIASSVVPSRLGGYVVRELLANFTFVENTMFDTYIADARVWQHLRELSIQIDAERNTVKRIRMRVDRAKVFFEYMHECFKPIVAEARKRGLPAQWCHDCMEERQVDFRRELTRVLASARNTSKKLKEHQANIETMMEEEDMSNV
jgi:GTPase SAR1 family protein